MKAKTKSQRKVQKRRKSNRDSLRWQTGRFRGTELILDPDPNTNPYPSQDHANAPKAN